MPLKFHICQFLHVHTLDNDARIYTSYELTATNHVTGNNGIHIFHIPGILPCANKYAYHIAHI